jgi:SAM-dependent methyltransferase
MKNQPIIDKVVLSEITYIQEDPLCHLREIYQLLKPNGILTVDFNRSGKTRGTKVVLGTDLFDFVKDEINSDVVTFKRRDTSNGTR